MKPWIVTVRHATGTVIARTEVKGATRRAARAAGLVVLARMIGPRGIMGTDSVTAAPVGDPGRTLARRLVGRMSPRLAWIMSGILGHDFGVRDSHGNACGPLTVTSDGFALGAMGNAFIGDVADVRDNFRGLLDHVGATDAEREHAERCYRERVRTC